MSANRIAYQGYLLDYHTHHDRCGHAQGSISDYVEEAIRLGFKEIGISDHAPIYHLGPHPQARPHVAMSQIELGNYVTEMAEMKTACADRIILRKGVESDYIPGWDEHYRQLWKGYPLDYVIGSVHWLGEWNVSSKELPLGRTAQSVLNEYLQTTEGLIRSGAFDIVGHWDAIKTRGRWTAHELAVGMADLLPLLAKTETVVEINTARWNKSSGETCPSRELLRLCHQQGVRVTLGSDAHRPGRIGYYFDQTVELLLDIGFKEIVGFADRQPYSIALVK